MHKIKHLFTIVLFLLVVFNCKGQQEGQYSLYMLNPYEYNPAYAGLDFSLSANLSYRNQWDVLPGNPKHIGLNAHLPYYKWSGALGVMINNRSQGALDLNTFGASYNYVIPFLNGLLSTGARIGFHQLSITGSEIVTPDGVYVGGINHNDPILLEGIDRGFGFRWELGSFFYNKNFKFGVAIQNLPSFEVNLETASFDKVTHANFMASMNYTLFEKFEVLPSILLKTDFKQFQSEISSLFKINGNIFGGLSARGYSSRSIDALVFITGIELGKHYTLTYSYDYGLSGLQRVHEGTHEILLNYNLKKIIGSGRPPKIVYNPRYL